MPNLKSASTAKDYISDPSTRCPGASRLIPVMERLVSSGSRRAWARRAFADFARMEALYVSTQGLPWIEIDTPEDYGRATKQVFHAFQHAVEKHAEPLRRGA